MTTSLRSTYTTRDGKQYAALGICNSCGIDRDHLLHMNDFDEAGRWIGANNIGLLMSCKRTCGTWPAWMTGVNCG